MSRLRKRVKWIFDRQWDYQYLKSVINRGYDEIENVFVGSSYVVFGINNIEKSVILALPSQDIYYSCALLKRVLNNQDEKKIKRIIMGMGGYSLYHDLSMTKSFDENNRIFDIYYPILCDMHNMQELTYNQTQKRFGIVDKIIRFAITKLYFRCNIETYFDKNKQSRTGKARVTWEDKNKMWENLSEKERVAAAKKRVLQHEKMLKYEYTKEENIQTMKTIYNQCKDRNIKLYTFLAPMSEEYMNNMSEDYKNKIIEVKNVLNSFSDGFIDYTIKGNIDLEIDDFVDADHLSDKGAEKFTKQIVKDWLEKD